jgi:hypothetical protein
VAGCWRNGEVRGRNGGAGTGEEVAVEVPTDENGLAECGWRLDGSTLSQSAEAYLLDASDVPVQPPVRFTANLSVASRVAYDPTCELLADAGTLQQAIDVLCEREKGLSRNPASKSSWCVGCEAVSRCATAA